MSILDYCRNVNIELSLFELIISLFAIVIVTEIVLVVKKIVLALNKQRKIDNHLRETRDRISRVVTEIEEYKVKISEVEVEVEAEEIIKQNSFEEEVPCVQEVSEVAVKRKKTRAMSMEERWAEYDKKRSMRSTFV